MDADYQKNVNYNVMITLTQLSCLNNLDHDKLGTYILEPLCSGQGVTMGNLLRRILLTEISSYSITSLRINNIKHEFGSIEGLQEDILELIINIKDIRFKEIKSSTSQKKSIGFLFQKGPAIITAGHFKLESNFLKVLNTNLYLGSIINNSEIFIEIDIRKGIGYSLNENYLFSNDINTIFTEKLPATISLDTSFNPIKKVNYKVKLIYDDLGNLKESLLIEILTNGTIDPLKSLYEANKKALKNLFSIYQTKALFLDILQLEKLQNIIS